MQTRPIEPHVFSDRLHELVAFYVEKLGFTLAQHFPEGDGYTWCQLRLGDATLMASTPPDPEQAPNDGMRPLYAELQRRRGQPGEVCHYIAVPNVDEYFARVTGAGVVPLESLWDSWWGNRQFSIPDLDGNLLTFFTPNE